MFGGKARTPLGFCIPVWPTVGSCDRVMKSTRVSEFDDAAEREVTGRELGGGRPQRLAGIRVRRDPISRFGPPPHMWY